MATDRYLTAEEKTQYEEQQLAAVGLSLAEPPQAMWQETADTVQAAPSVTPTGITQSDIEAALLQWNGDEDSKARLLAYMQAHSRERGTADWLKMNTAVISLHLPFPKTIYPLNCLGQRYKSISGSLFCKTDFCE